MIIGTAGHVDHGKSALVEALTGTRMDRLVEERRRGITIELNFAPLDLGDGRIASVIDVPGHEDLVRTMVAGASGIDCVLLVVAADEGIMPQTVEHLLVAEMLQVRRGIAVITKADTVEPDWLELIRDDIGRRLAASTIRFGAPIATSARTGAGIEELRARLREVADDAAQRAADDLFRLPIDRVFSVAGVGTVVTGTSWSGSTTVGAEVVALPSGAKARVRSLESHGQSVDRAQPGMRIAIGLHGVAREEVERGQQLVSPEGGWIASRRMDAELSLDAKAPRPLVRRTRVRVLLGTAEVLARVTVSQPIEPGTTAIARLILEAPLVARGGDRFVLRSYSPVQTIGGGRVLDPDPPPRRKGELEELRSPELGRRLQALVARRSDGLPVSTLPVLLGTTPTEVARTVAETRKLHSIHDRLVLSERVRGLEKALGDAVARFHRINPSDAGTPAEVLRQSLHVPEWLSREIVERLVQRGELEWRDGLIARVGFVAKAPVAPADVAKVMTRLEAAGLTPPSTSELATELPGVDVAAALRILTKDGRTVPVERDRYFAKPALDAFAMLLRDLAAGGEFTPAAVRDRSGVSRKYVIPLLEWADRSGLTIRTGDGRRLARA